MEEDEINDNEFTVLSLLLLLCFFHRLERKVRKGISQLKFPQGELGLFTTNKIYSATVSVAMATVLRLHLSAKRAKQGQRECLIKMSCDNYVPGELRGSWAYFFSQPAGRNFLEENLFSLGRKKVVSYSRVSNSFYAVSSLAFWLCIGAGVKS